MNSFHRSHSPRRTLLQSPARQRGGGRNGHAGVSVERLEARHLLAGQGFFAPAPSAIETSEPALATAVTPRSTVHQTAVDTITGAFGVNTVHTSTDGRFQLKLRPGGDLWLTTSWAPDQPYWRSRTDGSNADAAVMQGDGNFVLYRNSVAVWSTGTSGYPGSILRLQDDGNLVVYAPGNVAKWNSQTSWAGRSPSPGSDRLVLNEILSRGDSRYSPNRQVRLVLQDDGNLVLYAAGAAEALWNTGTFGKPVTGAVVQPDGNLVLYNTANQAAWDLFSAGRIPSRPGAYLRVQDDGNLVFYDPNSGPLWSSGTSLPGGTSGVFIPPNNTSSILIPPGALTLPASIVLTGDTNNSGQLDLGGRLVAILTGGNTLNQNEAVNANALVIGQYQTADQGTNLTGSPPVATTLNLTGGATLTAPGGLTVDGVLGLSSGNVVTTNTPVTVSSKGRLRGAGTVAGALNLTGTLAPAGDAAASNPFGKFTVGQLSCSADGRLEFQVAGPVAGTNHDQLVVTGGLAINGAVLALDVSHVPRSGSPITLVDNRGSSPISGVFRDAQGNSLGEDAIVVADISGSGLPGRISYRGGDGNDVVLKLGVDPPSSPGGVTGTVGNARISLTWAAPASNGGAAVSDYVIRYSGDNGTTWTRFVDAVSSATSATVTGLTNGVSYVFKVSAINAAGVGTPSATSAAVIPLTTPTAPANLAGVAGNRQVSLTWSIPVSNGGADLTDYIIRYSSDNGATWTRFVDGISTATTATVTGLTNGVDYVFKVLAVNKLGIGMSSATSAVLTPITVPNAPTSIKGVARKKQVTLTWSAPTSAGGGGVFDYVVQFSRNKGSTWTTFVDGVSGSTTATVTGLTSGIPYVFRVAAVNAAGTSAFSTTSASVTPRA